MRRRWVKSLLAVGILLGVYVGVWRPVRTWSTLHLFGPLLEASALPGWQVGSNAPSPSVQMVLKDQSLAYHAPAGRAFLVPALLLVALARRKRYGLRLFAVALGLGLVQLICALLAVRNVPGAAELLAFLGAYVEVPLLVGLTLLWTRVVPESRHLLLPPDP